MDKQSFIYSKKFLIIVFSVFSFIIGFALASIWFTSQSNRNIASAASYTDRAGNPLGIQYLHARNTNESGAPLSDLKSFQEETRVIAARVLPTVVEIDVVDVIKQTVPALPSPFEFFFGPRDDSQTPKEREFKAQGLGSGVIVRRTGNKVYVLTNNHVAGDAEEISVRLQDGRQYKAKLVGKDPNKDLALVEFETGENVPVAELGDSNTLQVGDWVMAVGNPLGFTSTVTTGIVSAIGRHSLPGSDIADFTDYIQTDAAINQGNSGGALVNIDGQVIGISTWIASPSGGSVGLGFAIPINNAKKAINDFITKGKSEYGWLGVNIGNVSPDSAKSLKLTDTEGAIVYGVFKNSPADNAGILPGDFITRFNGEAVENTSELLMLVGNQEPGKKADIDLVRQGEPKHISVNVKTRAEEKEIAGKSNQDWPGFAVINITDDIRKQLNLRPDSGSLIISVVEQGSPAGIAGFKAGDIIHKVNGTPVSTMLDFYRTFNSSSSKEIMLNISRQNNELIIGLIK
jgi:Do/DeqQ family serine protease